MQLQKDLPQRELVSGGPPDEPVPNMRPVSHTALPTRLSWHKTRSPTGRRESAAVIAKKNCLLSKPYYQGGLYHPVERKVGRKELNLQKRKLEQKTKSVLTYNFVKGSEDLLVSVGTSLPPEKRF